MAGLGRCALAAGDATDAPSYLRQAHQIFQRTGAIEAAGIAAELSAIAQPDGTPRVCTSTREDVDINKDTNQPPTARDPAPATASEPP